MQKRTEKYDLAIPETNDTLVKKELQKICDTRNLYPYRIAKVKNGMVISFIRNIATPQYLFSGQLFDLINDLKMALSVATIIQKKTLVTIEETNMPKEIIAIKKEERIESDEKDSEFLKKLEEDLPYFDSFVGKQILESDYDSQEGRAADKRAIKIKKISGKLIIPENEFGQIAFNMNKY